MRKTLRNIVAGTALALTVSGCGSEKPKATENVDNRESVNIDGRVVDVVRYHADSAYLSSGLLREARPPVMRELRIKSNENTYHVTTAGNKWDRIEERDSVILSGTCKYQGCKLNKNGDIDLVYAKVKLVFNK